MDQDRLVIISSFPNQGEVHARQTVGVASYTRQLVDGLRLVKPDWRIEVLAEKAPGLTQYQEDDLVVNRMWERDNLISLWRLLRRLKRQKPKRLLVSLEGFMFGGWGHLAVFLLGLVWLKVVGIKIVIVLHQVVDFMEFGKKPINYLFAVCNWVLLRMVGIVAAKVIVFEEGLKTRFGEAKKVVVLPHLIPVVEKVDRQQAKQHLGLEPQEAFGLYFGYIAPYKGVLELVQNWPKDKQLIIAGGLNPNHRQKREVLNYYRQVEALVDGKRIKMVGFVPETEIADYFSACSMVILPYQVFMSSSGPLSLALAYRKPIVLSPLLKRYLESKDVDDACRQSGLDVNDLVTKITAKDLELGWEKRVKNVSKYERMADLLAKSRSLRVVTENLAEIIGAT